MNKFQEALRAHPDYEAYLNGDLDLIIIDDEACDFIFTCAVEDEDWSEDDEDFEDEVDESNYDPYAGCEVFEGYDF